MKNLNVAIIGGGIAGSVAYKLLQESGHHPVLFDDKDPFSGSQASSNLYIAHWFKKFGSSAAQIGVDTVDELYKGLIDKPFSKGLGYAMEVKHIHQNNLLVRPDIFSTVIDVGSDFVRTNDNTKHTDIDVTLLCCGYRIRDTCPNAHPNLTVRIGHALYLEGDLNPGESCIAMPMPYKHHKLYQFAPGVIYFANSTSVSEDSFKKQGNTLKQLLVRDAVRYMKRDVKILDYKIGYRPMLKDASGDFGALARLSKTVWSMNGGGKNGLVAYAYRARQFLQEINRELA